MEHDERRQKNASFIAAAALTVFAFILRAYALGENPAGLYCDEAANGYNGYTLFHSGTDQRGERYPLFIWSFLAYKYPLYIYPTGLWTGLFGLSESATRLQAAIYGSASVPLAFAIARHFAGNVGGITAAFTIAILPWNFHFSRIAFSLIGLPFWFGLGFLFLSRALAVSGSRRDWILAGCFLGLTPYSYAPALALVPPFLVLALLLHADIIWRQRSNAALGALAILIVVTPFLHFSWHHLEQQKQYATMISVFRGRSTEEALKGVAANYLRYFQPHFLFEHGDFVLRHRTKDIGQLYWAMVPWITVGILASLLRRNRNSKLLLIWLALYPLGAALNREVQSATRSITGSLLFPVITGIGVGEFQALLRSLAGKRGATLATTTAIAATLAFLLPQSADYFWRYWNDNPKHFAAGISGFQHGWREAFAYMESKRAEVDAVRLTTSAVNQAQIFARFYTDRSEDEIQRWGRPEHDYRSFFPRYFKGWYRPDQDILFAMREKDLVLIDSWDERFDVRSPNGKLSFAILRNPAPKRFIQKWEITGPFANPRNKNRDKEFIEAKRESTTPGPTTGTQWTRMSATNGYLDLNTSLGAQMVPPTRNAEFQIAYLRTVIDSPLETETDLEVNGSKDHVVVWLNGELIRERQEIQPTSSLLIPIRLRKGFNTLLIKTIETNGDWWISARTLVR